jgi:hypothetical protein
LFSISNNLKSESAQITQKEKQRVIALWFVLILIVVVVTEAGLAAFLPLAFPTSGHFYLWNPDLGKVRSAWATDAGRSDDEIGWPSAQEEVSPPRDSTGAKANPDFPDIGHACISVYGDSFVWGWGVPLADGWVEQLAQQLRCRIANYGVPGYGTDQAYIRFIRKIADEARLVLLGIYPEDVMRNVNQYRGFIGYDLSPSLLKGRFVLDHAGHLDWVHRPQVDADSFVTLHREPAKVVPHDYLLPDTRDGPITPSFPSTVTLARIAFSSRMQARLSGRTWSDYFLMPDHPSGALVLTAAISEAFAREAERRGKRALVVILPAASSFRTRAALGIPEYSPLIAALATRRVEVFDPAPALLAALEQRSYCELYSNPAECRGHFSSAGSTIVAQVVASELRQRRHWP